MIQWYLNSSHAERAAALGILLAFIVVMSLCFKSLLFSRHGWYRGVHSTPIFQIIMWIGAIPLIIPALYLFFARYKKISNAKFIGNIRSRIFHYPQCEYQQKIQSTFFKYPLSSVEEARSEGFRECLVCNPESRRPRRHLI